MNDCYDEWSFLKDKLDEEYEVTPYTTVIDKRTEKIINFYNKVLGVHQGRIIDILVYYCFSTEFGFPKKEKTLCRSNETLLRQFKIRYGDIYYKNALKILTVLKSAGEKGLTRKEIYRSTQTISKTDRNLIYDELETIGLIKIIKGPNSSQKFKYNNDVLYG